MNFLLPISAVLLSLSILITGFNEKDLKPAESSWFIFGTYYGLCADNCTTIYKIEDGNLFLDEVDRVIPEDIPFLNVPLSSKKLEIAKAVRAAFPNDLLQESENQIGCPDCMDQGGFYLEWKENGVRKIWRIDTNEDTLPEYLKPFLQKINEAMAEL